MRLQGLVAGVLALFLACAAFAKAESVLFKSGDWELVGVDGFELSLFGENYEFDAICVAHTRSGMGSVTIGMFYREWSNVAPEVIGSLLGKIEIFSESFDTTLGNVTLVSGTGSYTITDAEHADDAIQFIVEAQHAPVSALSILTMMAGEDFRVEGENLGEAAVFSSAGFPEVIEALFECAGVN